MRHVFIIFAPGSLTVCIHTIITLNCKSLQGIQKDYGLEVMASCLTERCAQNYFRAGTRAAEAAKQKGVLALQAERQRRTADAAARQVRARCGFQGLRAWRQHVRRVLLSTEGANYALSLYFCVLVAGQ